MADVLGVELNLDERLRERRFGAWEGRLRAEVIREDRGRWDRWLDGEDVVAEVGGETAGELARRAVGVFEDLLERTDDGGVTIAVSHGGTIWHGVHTLLGLPIPSLGGVANASVATVVHWDDGGGFALDRWNEVAHLDLATVPDDRETSDAPPVGR